MRTRAVVVGAGAVTPLGLGAIETGFVYRTGAAAMTTAPLLDANEQPITFCSISTLDPLSVGHLRAVEMAIPAMEEALQPIAHWAPQLRVRMLLSIDPHLAEQTTGEAGAWGAAPPSHAAELVNALSQRALEIAPSTEIALCARGGGGPGWVLDEHLDALDVGDIDVLLFGGVHTDYDPFVIRRLEAEGRLYSSENLDALIPGESAAFVTLMRADIARRGNLRVWCRLHAVGSGWEEATPGNDHSAFEAKGLTAALRMALDEAMDEKLKVGWTITDLTFEMRRVYEWESILVRMRDALGDPWAMDSPAQRIGHLGAAALPLSAVLAAVAYARGYAPSKLALAMAGSDGGERGAIVLGEP